MKQLVPSLSKILRAKNMLCAVKIREYKTIVRPVVLNSSKTWTMAKYTVNKGKQN